MRLFIALPVPPEIANAAAAMVPPVASILIAYSPSARQSLPPVLHGVFVVPWVLNEKRGSNAFELFGAIDGYVYVFAVPGLPVSGVNVIFGVTAAAPRFCTMIELRRPTPCAFFAAYAP